MKVLDFGMSKFSEAEALTQDGYTLGTPEYMSPEQCIGAPVDAAHRPLRVRRADVRGR